MCVFLIYISERHASGDIFFAINCGHTVGVKRMSPVDTELLFIILYNIIALHRNTNIFFLWKSSNLNK